MTSHRIDDLIALAALGELSADEQRELDDSAERDPVVAAELSDALAAAASLQRPGAAQPSAALRNSVLAAIAATPQEDPVDVEVPVRAARDAPVVSLDAERVRRRVGRTFFAAAAAVLFVVGGVVVVATKDSSSDPIAAVVDASDATTRSLAGEINELTVTYSASEDALVVQGSGLPVLATDATYQLWLVDDEGARSVGIFRPDVDGDVSERFADTDPTGFVLGVTQEPAGGSDSPTLPILASA